MKTDFDHLPYQVAIYSADVCIRSKLIRLTCVEASKTYNCTVMLRSCLAQHKILFIVRIQIGPRYTDDSKCIGRQAEPWQLLIQFIGQQLSHGHKYTRNWSAVNWLNLLLKVSTRILLLFFFLLLLKKLRLMECYHTYDTMSALNIN